MIIESVRVRNFRSLLDATLLCDELTALVGPNGAGKSTFLGALDLFYSASPKIDAEDFYNSDATGEISIGVTFVGLSADARKLFASYIQGDKLTVERVLKWDNGKTAATYHGASLQSPAFQAIRDGLAVKDRGRTARPVYEAIRIDATFADLPAWSSLGEVEPALKNWEADHPDQCARERDDGRFFGFTEVGHGYLGRFTRFLFIPAVRDASEDAAEGRGSVLTELMDMVVRSVLANKQEVREFKEETQQRYNDLMKAENLPELGELAADLSMTLRALVPNASVDLRWLPTDEIRIEMPKADVKLVEDHFATAVQRTGHGLQRAFILTVLQHLAKAQSAFAVRAPEAPEGAPDLVSEPEVKITLPSLVLAIEEPELYQHPNRQRHLARILLQLGRGTTPGVAERTQVIYTTHSPLFVGLDRFNQVRLIRKTDNGEGNPKVTRAIGASLDTVAEKVWLADGKQGRMYTGETMVARLRSIMTPWANEGFFADVVVLVEGEDDYAAIVGVARAMNRDLESLGISVIPMKGKRSLDRPAIIFGEFGIPVYLVWDSDGNKGESAGECAKCGRLLDAKPDPTENHRLLRIVGRAEEDWPAYRDARFCCFKNDLETTLRTEIGVALFEKLLSQCQEEFGISKRSHAVKNPALIAAIVEGAQREGASCKTLQDVVESIVALSGASVEEQSVP